MKPLTENQIKNPGQRGKGRKPGAKNKYSRTFKEGLLQAYHDIGGPEALAAWGRENQTEFYKIAARLIPTELVGAEGKGPVAVTVTHVYEPEPRG